ncbi:MAG: hypothetical protein IPL35_17675 [Sphingobacteriales bacterium]|nr:hypothetical protein [Sphingobacteriales bacterium]
MYVASDGGISKTTHADEIYPDFYNVNKGYNITQFYSVAAGHDGKVMGGTQDNGTNLTTFGVNSIKSTTEVNGGDGGYAEVSNIKPNILFAGNPEGALYRSSNGGDGFAKFFDENIDCKPLNADGGCSGDGVMDNGGGFVTPFVLWEDEMLYYTIANYQPNADNPLPHSITYNNQTFTITSNNGLRVITGLAVDPQDDARVAITAGNYGNNKYVILSTNATSTNPTFASVQSNLPFMPVYDVVIDDGTSGQNALIVASELGVWYYDPAAQNWSPQTEELGIGPVVRIRQESMARCNAGYLADLQLKCKVIYIGTHGRGMYRSTSLANPFCTQAAGSCVFDLPSFNPTTGIEEDTQSVAAIQLFPNRYAIWLH